MYYVCVFVYCFAGFGLPSVSMVEPKNPHCFEVTCKEAVGPVTGYRVHCFSGDSQKAEIVKDILDGNQESEFVSGLKPGTTYKVAITAVSSGIESKLVFSKDKVTLRKLILINIYFFQCM